MSKDEEYPVGATRTSFRIVEALARADGPLGVTDVATELDVAKSVVHNHLSTLRALGYVVKRDRRYEPSLEFLSVGERVRRRSPLFAEARPRVDNLSNTTGEAAGLVTEEADRARVTYVSADGEVSPELHAGATFALAECAAGRAMLSHLPDRVDRLLDDADDAAAETLRDDLDGVRADGVAFSDGEQFADVLEVAAPVIDESGHACAAIAVYGPTDRLSGRHLQEDIVGQVLSTARTVETTLRSR